MTPELKNLIQDLAKQDWFARQRAAKALGKMGEEAKEAIPALLNALRDDEAPVRTAAKMALQKIASEEEIARLKDAGARQQELKSASSTSKQEDTNELSEETEFLDSIANYSEKTRRLAKGLFAQDWKERLSAVQLLSQVGAESLVCLKKALEDGNEYIRREAATGLGKIPAREAGPCVQALIDRLSDPVAGVRKTAAWSIGELAVVAESAIPVLVERLNDTDKEVRAACAWSLGIFGELARTALQAALQRIETRIAAGALDALGNMGYHAAPLIAEMRNLFAHSDRDVRYSLVIALGKIGPASKACTSDLISLLQDEDAEVRWRSAETLRKIGTPEAKDAWSNFNEQAKDAVPGLIRKLNKQDDEWARKSAADTLGKMQAETAVPFLLRALSDNFSFVRSAAAAALQRIGSKEALKALEDYKGDSSEELNDLLSALLDENPDTRLDAARALWGYTDERAVEALIQALSDSYEHIRDAARLALKKAGTDKARAALGE